MFYTLIYLQTGAYDGWGIPTFLATAITGLVTAIVMLYKGKEKAVAEKDKALKEKDEQILAIINDHKTDIKLITKDHELDMKEWNSDMKVFIGNYHTFMQQITDLANGSKRNL